MSSAISPNRPLTVLSLEKKFQTILGERVRLEEAEYEWVGIDGYAQAERYWRERLVALNGSLAAIEKSIRLFEPRWNRSSMTPKKRHQTKRLFNNPTKFQSAVWSVMRQRKQALKIAEIVDGVAIELNLKSQTREQRQRLWGMTYSILRAFKTKRLVDCVGKPARWFLVGDIRFGDHSTVN